VTLLGIAYRTSRAASGVSFYDSAFEPLRAAVRNSALPQERVWKVEPHWTRTPEPWHGLAVREVRPHVVVYVRLFGDLIWLVHLEQIKLTATAVRRIGLTSQMAVSTSGLLGRSGRASPHGENQAVPDFSDRLCSLLESRLPLVLESNGSESDWNIVGPAMLVAAARICARSRISRQRSVGVIAAATALDVRVRRNIRVDRADRTTRSEHG